MDFSNIPHYQYIPGRQEAIDHAGKIDKQRFKISLSVLFGTAIFSVVVRLVIRIFGHVPWSLDDGLVVTSAALLASGFATCLHKLDTIYLIEAINKGVAFPFQEDLANILSVQKWSTITAFLVWTSVYLVKFTFLYFFHILVRGMPRKIRVFFWSTVGLSVAFWIYTVLEPLIICPHFGADAAKCSVRPEQHIKSIVGNLLIALVDIISDVMIITIPLVILSRSLMPTARKVSLAAMLCLSIVMIVIALIRLIGTIIDTRLDGHGAAPVWVTYWTTLEGCVSVTMTSVIVIRAIFITRGVRERSRARDSLWSRAGRRLLSTLRLPRSFASSKQSSPPHSDDNQRFDSKQPRISTQVLTNITFSNVNEFITGGKESHQKLDNAMGDAHINDRLRDLEDNVIRKDFTGQPSGTTDE
ncbi:hypothetical protein F4680DRAFT_450415 [Xylaria scruposa]|nr:hypothetical protein F4680DRAFT_450415 [Xylaria scruposa]